MKQWKNRTIEFFLEKSKFEKIIFEKKYFGKKIFFQKFFLKTFFYCSIVPLFHGPHPHTSYLRKFSKKIFFSKKFFFKINFFKF